MLLYRADALVVLGRGLCPDGSLPARVGRLLLHELETLWDARSVLTEMRG